jgi:hypothetical protein
MITGLRHALSARVAGGKLVGGERHRLIVHIRVAVEVAEGSFAVRLGDDHEVPGLKVRAVRRLQGDRQTLRHHVKAHLTSEVQPTAHRAGGRQGPRRPSTRLSRPPA